MLKSFRQTSWNILPPSNGPIGSRLNSPIPMFSMNSQNSSPELHFIIGGVHVPYFCVNSCFGTRLFFTCIPRYGFVLFSGCSPSVMFSVLLSSSVVIVSPGFSGSIILVMFCADVILTPLIPVIMSPCCSPASFDGPSTVTVCTPCCSNAAVSSGFAAKNNPNMASANRMFDIGPAANSPSCCLFGLFCTVFSSGSTNAAGITGSSRHKNAKPLLFTGMLCALASTPCENSCTSASRNMLIIQYRNGTKNTPFASIGSTGCIPGAAFPIMTSIVLYISCAQINSIPMKPSITDMSPSAFSVRGNFLAILSIVFSPNELRYIIT